MIEKSVVIFIKNLSGKCQSDDSGQNQSAKHFPSINLNQLSEVIIQASFFSTPQKFNTKISYTVVAAARVPIANFAVRFNLPFG